MKIEKKHRELAVAALHKAPGVIGCMTIMENMWIEQGGSFLELHRKEYGRAPDFYNEPQHRFLDAVAQCLADNVRV